ncbi:unnamed protein product [Peronospora farinosa]|uniref:Uncharacterized protein n=1 Tax=Peronospora farinosa TaxID=134698 RepID=A0AAV0TRI4_9STRA|nr:unnamed protein product [Peronospora farinosa]
MKPAATFARIMAVGAFIAAESAPNAPALRGLRMNADIPTVKENTEESRKGHHHHVKKVKKVKKIAIPVPVEVPHFIPVPVSIPSTVIAGSNTAVVDSTTNVASTNVASTNVASTNAASNNVVAAGTNVALGSAAVTPAPTTANVRPVATPAPTVTRGSRATPAPTNVASADPSPAQQPRAAAAIPQSGDAGIAGV